MKAKKKIKINIKMTEKEALKLFNALKDSFDIMGNVVEEPISEFIDVLDDATTK